MDSAIDPTGYRDESSDNERSNAASTSVSSFGAPGQTIEDDVKQLAGSISSWWTDFSKKSQKQLNDVRAQIDAQGGIVSMAKREAARFEAQLSDAQETARKNVNVDEATRKRQSVDLDGWGVAGTTAVTSRDATDAGGMTKGKGKEQTQGDDGVEVERLEERARLKKERGMAEGERRSIDLSHSTGEALFDADNSEAGSAGGNESEFKAIEDAAQTAINSMQSFWDKIQTDPRVNKLQASVAKTLQDIKLPTVTTNAVDGTLEMGGSDISKQAKQQSSVLPDLSEQFQKAFPKLDLKESQAMAKRYFEASQAAALDWTKEMGNMMTDLVHVVPPEEARQSAEKARVSSEEKASGAVQAAVPSYAEAPAFTEEDDFDWDKEVEAESVDGLETTTGPQTASWDDEHDVDQVQTVSEAEEASERAAARHAATEKNKEEREDDEDSDWE